MAMERSPASWGSGHAPTTMIERAKEELEMLEAQHPKRFGYLKVELKSFISLLQSQYNLLPLSDTNNMATSSTVGTQASSTTKKRGRGIREKREKEKKSKTEVVSLGNLNQRRDRVEVVMEKAQACLVKIQLFKTSFS
ncbi:hypothetical protein NMG60_11026482 [Bertholletia excelsa]